MASPLIRTGLALERVDLLLLVPLPDAGRPVVNTDQPRLFGLPFFYWIQFAFVPVGVICVAIVF